MSYQVLARKWRPKTFAEMVGQAHVLQALINALNSQRLHHAYLFSGTRGVGKTTIARILAKCLNCEQGISAEPCGVCGACTEINEGRFVDLIEVDAASRTRVDDTRELLDNVQYTPTRARFKIYLIDEVHMLSDKSFNALLKTLEEPPEHVKFLLATTDPQKLPVTVLSRCLQFNLKHLDTAEIHQHLCHILQQENVQADDQGVWQLADAANGSLRDALSLTDQAIGFGNGEIRSREISAMLGTIAPDLVHRLLLTLANNQGKDILETIGQLAEGNPDYLAALDSLLLMLHETAVYQAVPESLDPDNHNHQKIIELAGLLTAEDIQLFYQIGVNCKADFQFAPSPRSAFEMTLLRMLAFKPCDAPQPALTAPPENEGEANPAKKPEPATSSPVTRTPIEKAAPQKPAVASNPPETPASPIEENKAQAVNDSSAAASGPEKNIGTIAGTNTATNTSTSISTLPENNEEWIAFANQLALSGMTKNIVLNCVFSQADSNQLGLVLDENQSVLFNDTHKARIARAISEKLGIEIALDVAIAHLHQESPQMRAQRLSSEKQLQAQEIFEKDSFVQEIVERFSGTINTSSIEALD